MTLLLQFHELLFFNKGEVSRYYSVECFMSYVALCCFNWTASAVFFNILFSLKAVKISLEIYDNQLSKWENRMLVIKIIKLHEIYPTSGNICISPSCILIKHHVSVTIRLRRLWWKWEKSANDWRGFYCMWSTWSCFKSPRAITCKVAVSLQAPQGAWQVCSSLQLLLKERWPPQKTKLLWSVVFFILSEFHVFTLWIILGYWALKPVVKKVRKWVLSQKLWRWGWREGNLLLQDILPCEKWPYLLISYFQIIPLMFLERSEENDTYHLQFFIWFCSSFFFIIWRRYRKIVSWFSLVHEAKGLHIAFMVLFFFFPYFDVKTLRPPRTSHLKNSIFMYLYQEQSPALDYQDKLVVFKMCFLINLSVWGTWKQVPCDCVWGGPLLTASCWLVPVGALPAAMQQPQSESVVI